MKYKYSRDETGISERMVSKLEKSLEKSMGISQTPPEIRHALYTALEQHKKNITRYNCYAS